MSTDCPIRNVIGSRKRVVNKKEIVEYLVDWEPSYTTDISAAAIKEYEESTGKCEVIGPSKVSKEKAKSVEDWRWIIKRNDEYFVVSYEKVTTRYLKEYLKYINSRLAMT